MNKILIATLSLTALTLTACGGGGSSSNGGTTPAVAKQDVNVAASSNGATVSSTTANSANLIDGDTNTTWTSSPTVPATINFGSKNVLKSITITKLAPSATVGSAPDILVQFSEDGVTYVDSAITKLTGSTIGCSSNILNATSLYCLVNSNETTAYQYMRILSQNGKSFTFSEVEVISNK